jgi:AcrR family transcriptional regulator
MGKPEAATQSTAPAADATVVIAPPIAPFGTAGAMVGAAAGEVRRLPVQRRSLERFERLLDACAELLDEVGYEALSTSQIAKRARVPIGTLYQFFDGKPALARALARRNLETFLERLRARFAAEPARDWPSAGGLVVAEFVAMKRDIPGFAVVDFGEVRRNRPFMLDAEAELENNQIVAQRLKELVIGELGLPDVPGLDAVLLTAVEAADGVLRLAFRYGPSGDPDLLAEADALIRGYLALRLSED